MKKDKLKNKILANNNKKELVGYGPVSKTDLIKCYFELSDIYYDTIKMKGIDVNVKNVYNLPAITIGVDRLHKTDKYGNSPLYFYINYKFTQTIFVHNSNLYRFEIYTLDPNEHHLTAIAHADYLIDYGKDDIFITNMIVEKEYRRLGVGTELHDFIENIAAQIKTGSIVLDSLQRAQAFHRANGFKIRKNPETDEFTKPTLHHDVTYMIKKKYNFYKPNIKCPFSLLSKEKSFDLEELVEKEKDE